MTRNLCIICLAALAFIVLSACTGNESASNGGTGSQVGKSPVPGAEPSSSEQERLSADYPDALPIEEQLALGTIRLEESELAVDLEQAAELLPLWRAYQSLSDSEITAPAELQAVVNELQDTMTPAQLSTISEMRLNSESLTTLLEEGGLAFGRGGFGRLDDAEDEGGNGSGFAGGFFPGGVPGPGAGGGPPGGFVGGGPGGPGIGNLSEDDIATRQAQFDEGDPGDFQGRMLTGAVIRLLQEKSGEIPAPEGIFATILEVVAGETGQSIEELQKQMADGKTLSEVVADAGADQEAIQNKLVDTLSDLDQFQGQDLKAFIDNLFD